MKWLGVVLKNTNFSRLLPVLASSLTMEQIDELISAKAAGIIAKQEHVKAEEKRTDDVAEVGTREDDDDGMKHEPFEEDLDTKSDDDTDAEAKEKSGDDSAVEEMDEEEDGLNREALDPLSNSDDGDLAKQSLALRREPETPRRKYDKKPLECKECSVVFTTRSRKRYHMKNAHSTPQRCTLCQMEFTSASSLRRHDLVHQEGGDYPCTTCAKVFKRKSTLTEHARIHTGEKPFSCLHCPYRASSSSLLAHHRRKHMA